MSVEEGWFSGVKYSAPPSMESLPPNVAEAIKDNICLNSKAFYIEEPGKKTEFVGNRTECALLMLCDRDFGVPYDSVRKKYEGSVPYVRILHLASVFRSLFCIAMRILPPDSDRVLCVGQNQQSVSKR